MSFNLIYVCSFLRQQLLKKMTFCQKDDISVAASCNCSSFRKTSIMLAFLTVCIHEWQCRVCLSHLCLVAKLDIKMFHVDSPALKEPKKSFLEFCLCRNITEKPFNFLPLFLLISAGVVGLIATQTNLLTVGLTKRTTKLLTVFEQ